MSERLEELLPAQEAIEADQARENFAKISLFCVHLMHVFQERMAWGLLQASHEWQCMTVIWSR